MSLTSSDKKNIWHPYTQEKISLPNIPIIKGKGAYLYTEDGRCFIDAVSSWWVNIHGHANPYIAKKIAEQSCILEQVIFAGFTHPKAVELSERLLKILPQNQKKIFFSDDGSTSVEVALKMSFQYWYNKSTCSFSRKKSTSRVKVIALEGAYHGDTFGSMSVSERSIFSQPFSPLLFDVIHIPFPDKNCEKTSLKFLKSQLSLNKEKISAFIFEPLVQGASGMRIYRAEILDEMIKLCKENDIITIADEVMTGFGRTGKMFACDYLNEKPDILCLSKGITGGFLPLGLTSCSQHIYNAFYSDDKLKTFFHGHSYTANPVACAAACANLDIFEKKSTWSRVHTIEKMHKNFVFEISGHPAIKEIRNIGTILALELASKNKTSYLNDIRDELYVFFILREILVRPLGNILYIMPPYCIEKKDLKKIYETIKEFLKIKYSDNQ